MLAIGCAPTEECVAGVLGCLSAADGSPSKSSSLSSLPSRSALPSRSSSLELCLGAASDDKARDLRFYGRCLSVGETGVFGE